MLDKLREIFISNVQSEAERQKLTYVEIAKRSGLSRSGIYKIMHGDREPGFDNIERLAKALKIDPYRLLLAPGQVAEPTHEAVLEIVRKALETKPIPAPAASPPLVTTSPPMNDEIRYILKVLTSDERLIKRVQAALKGAGIAFDKPESNSADGSS